MPGAEWLWLTFLLALCGLAHGFNLFGFPYRESDEGTYISQAWAVVHLGRLAPYTYWYDHAPAGWLQVALWTVLTGGFDTFGAPINSGRVLMLIFRLGSLLLVYRTARSVTSSVAIVTCALLLFGLSSYGIYYGRRLLLDNIAAFWMLLALYLLVSRPLTPRGAVAAGLALAVSVLSKEVALAIVPVAAAAAWRRAPSGRKTACVVAFTVTLVSICSLYPLMAALKGELLPSDLTADGAPRHVSLIEAVRWQATRERDGGILDRGSAFWFVVRHWLRWERFLVVAGTLAAAVNVLLIRKSPAAGLLGVAVLSLWAFLGRGVSTYEFYLLPLVPLLALSLALAVERVAEVVADAAKRPRAARWAQITVPPALAGCCIVALAGGYRTRDLRFGPNPWPLWSGRLSSSLWSNRQADALSQAADWVAARFPPRSRMVIDISVWVELHQAQDGGRGLDHAHYYWRVARDPAIRDGVFDSDGRSVDGFVVTPQLRRDVNADDDCAWVAAALARSRLIARFDSGGWPIEIRAREGDSRRPE
jgi:hypothetical protein